MSYLKNRIYLTVSAAALAISPSVAFAADGDEKDDVLDIIKPYVDARYRLETVDQDGKSRDATASTLRVNIGIVTKEVKGFSIKVEGQAIVNIGAEKFNDTLNGKVQFPVVADPEDVVLNQAYVRWRKADKADIKVGRQTVNLDNQRWIGSVGWRQNDQVMDAALATVTPIKGFSATYGYSWRVNRIFGPDSPRGIFRSTDIHMIRGSYKIRSFGTISAYGYLLDIPQAPGASSKTFGVRFAGGKKVGDVKFLYAAEYGRQKDHGLNPNNFGLDYIALEQGLALGPVTAKLGVERLEGNGTVALQTPLATLHKFNGWADKFLGTPANGLRDLYADITFKVPGPTKLKGLLLKAVYHDFNSTRGKLNYGHEWDFLIAKKFGKHLSLSLKYADYKSTGFATDTQKFWFTTQIKF